MSQLFIYSVVEENGEALTLDPGPLRGIDGAPLETVSHQGLAAVVGRLEPGRYQGPADPGPPTDERLRGDMQRYQEVNLFLLERFGARGILPLRFGLTARDEDEVRDVLGKVFLQLKAYLGRVRGSVELVVQASWDLPAVLREIRESEGFLGGALAAGRPVDPVEAGRALFEASEARKLGYVGGIHAALLPLSRDHAEGPRRDDSVILNHGYLVEKAKEPLFDDAVNALAERYDGRVTFRYVGPLPAYSFVNIELNQGNFGLVEKARVTMGLPERATAEEIRATYRRLMFDFHPDRNPGDAGAALRCKEVVEANEVLGAYCESASSTDAPLSFSREDVEKVFVAREHR